MFWQITSYPRCEYHVFLSHCAADRADLVFPVYEELKRKGIIPWLDRDDYYYGRDSRSALRDGLLRSRHVVFFITQAMMEYRRGWCAMELAYSDLLQSNFAYAGGHLLHFELPLLFLDRSNAELSRTVWDILRDRGRYHPPSGGDAVAWAAEQIHAFLHREQDLALDMAKVVLPGQPIHSALGQWPGLVDRITRFDPSNIP